MDLDFLSSLTSYPDTLDSKLRIRFQDCDPFLHLNQACYLNYFVNAREDHIREHYGLDTYKYARETGQGWMVTKNQIAYLRQVMVNEVVTVESHITAFDDTRIEVEFIMWDEFKFKPKALLWATYTFVNLNEGKRAKHSHSINAFFAKIKWNGLVPGTGFDDRIRDLYNIGR